MTPLEIKLDNKTEEASTVIRRVLSEDPSRACVTCSFQAECMVVVDLLVAEQPDMPVLFLETGYHFPETYAYRDQMTERLRLNLVNLSSRLTVAEQESQFGILYQSAPDRCCGMRKVDPLFRGLGRLRHLVHRTAPRAIADPGQSAGRGSFQIADRASVAQSESAGRLDQRRRVELSETARHSRASAI